MARRKRAIGTRVDLVSFRGGSLAGVVLLALIGASVGCTPGTEARARCELATPGTTWVVEGHVLDLQLRCGGDSPRDAREFELASLPEGARYDSGSRRLSWTPALDQAALYEVGVTVRPSGERLSFRIGVVDDWDHPRNVPVVDPARYPSEYGLPVFFLPAIPQDSRKYHRAPINYAGRVYDARIRRRGKASLSYPKNNFTLKFPKGAPFSAPDMAGGFRDKRKVSLTQTFDDNSYIRTRLAFDLWNRLNENNIQIKSYSAVVYVDGEYHGLYTVSDHVDGSLLKAQGLWEDGNLYKAALHDANFDRVTTAGEPKTALYQGFEKKEGIRDGGNAADYSDLVELMRFVTTTDDETFTNGIGRRINIDDYSSWFILTTFLAANDSVGKNVYHYHDGYDRWRVVPWDFNESFGQTWKTNRTPAGEVNLPLDRNFLFERLVSNRHWEKELVRRYVAALEGPLRPDAITALIDGYINEIDSSARRDEEKWRVDYEDFYRWSSRDDFTGYEEEVRYVKQWVRERWRVFHEELSPR